MKLFIRTYCLEILTVFMFAVITGTAIFMSEVTSVRRILMAFMFLFTLHEWEENRCPGGFSKIMQSFSGREFTPEQEAWSHVPVAVLLIVILIVPYLFDSVIFLAMIPVCLGIFECVVHIAGIFIHKTEKPYTPGLVTSVCLLAASVGAIRHFNLTGMADGKDYLLGALCMIACFAVMQRTVLAINGFGYRDMIENVKKKLTK